MTTDKCHPISLEPGDQVLINNEMYTLIRVDDDIEHGYRLVLSDRYDMIKSLVLGDDQYVTLVIEAEDV